MSVVGCGEQGINDDTAAIIREEYARSAMRWRTSFTIEDGVISIHDRRGRLVMGIGVQDGIYHAIDHEGSVIARGDTVQHATRAFLLI